MNSTQHIDANTNRTSAPVASRVQTSGREICHLYRRCKRPDAKFILTARVRIAAAALAAAALTGCDFLDLTPDDAQTMEAMWQRRADTEAYLYNIYAHIPDENGTIMGCPWLGASDEADLGPTYASPGIIFGFWNSASELYLQWDGYYCGIRDSFVFEANVDRCSELTDALREQYKCEARFLRGYLYWKLLQQYGPFVLLESAESLDGDWKNFTRTPYGTCVEYICRMMDLAADGLPWAWEGDNAKWLGKPTKFTCMAIKAEVLLMAASPQWNGNHEYADFTNRDGTPLVDATYRPEKWEAAADAALAVIRAAEENPEYGVKLYRNDEQGNGDVFNPYISVRDVHLASFNCETLWVKQGGVETSTVDYMAWWEMLATPYPGGSGIMAPTQRVVNAFYMMDGLGIEESPLYSEVGFAAAPHPAWTEESLEMMRAGEVWGHRVGEHRMFADREARFYAAILYNGRPIPQVEDEYRNKFSHDENMDGWGRVELYGYGRSGFQMNEDFSETGYLVLKNVSPLRSYDSGNRVARRPYILIRLARVYLDYIEALNEYAPANPDIRKYWDMIRSRAGLPSIFETHPQIAGDADAQRELILRERQVELCFENDRYFTTRRRWLAHLGGDGSDGMGAVGDGKYGDGGPMWGLDVEAGESFADESFYRRTVFENRVFEKKYYIFPIPQSEIDKNPLIVQNPWW